MTTEQTERKEQSSTIADAAQRLHVTPATLHTWRKKGYLLAIELPNGRYLVPESEIDRLHIVKEVSK